MLEAGYINWLSATFLFIVRNSGKEKNHWHVIVSMITLSHLFFMFTRKGAVVSDCEDLIIISYSVLIIVVGDHPNASSIITIFLSLLRV